MADEEDLYKGAPLQVGDEAPNFTCDSHLGMITFHEVLDGQFSMLVTFPNDFEAVATTELGMIAKLQEEFEGEALAARRRADPFLQVEAE